MGYSPWGRKESDTTGRLSTVYRFSDCSLSVCYIIFPIKTFSGLSTFVSSRNSNGMWWFSLGVSCTRENSMLSSENDEGWKNHKADLRVGVGLSAMLTHYFKDSIFLISFSEDTVSPFTVAKQ